MIDTSMAFSEGFNEDFHVVKWEEEQAPVLAAETTGLTWDFTEKKYTLKKLCRSLMSVHRESCVIGDLNFALEKSVSAMEKLYTECKRIGAISSKAKFEMPTATAISIKYALQQLTLTYKVTANLFNSITSFYQKYKDDPIDILSYINMNRVSKAERLLEQGHAKVKEVLQLSYALRFQSLGQAFVCAVRIKKRAAGRTKRELSIDLESAESKMMQKSILPRAELKVESPEESFQQGLFTKTHEEREATLWPVSPIGSLPVEASVNNSISSVVSAIPKTIFTPASALKPAKDFSI